jgi:hypothetical protein
MISWNIGKKGKHSFKRYFLKTLPGWTSLRVLKIRKEKADEYHSTYNPGPVVVRSSAGLAIQPRLGIRRQRDRWVPLASGYPGPVV